MAEVLVTAELQYRDRLRHPAKAISVKEYVRDIWVRG